MTLPLKAPVVADPEAQLNFEQIADQLAPFVVVNGPVSDSSFATKPADIAFGVDTLNGRLWVRYPGGAWHYTVLT